MDTLSLDLHVLAQGLPAVECVAWRPATDDIVAGGADGSVLRVTMSGDVDVIARLDAGALGVACHPRHGVIVCCPDLDAVFAVGAKGEVTLLAHVVAANFATVLPDGRIAVSSPVPEHPSLSALVLIATHQPATPVWRGCLGAFPNGSAWDSRTGRLLVIDSADSVIWAVDPDAPTGRPTMRARLSASLPDGLTMLPSGDVLVGCYEPSAFYVVRGNDVASVETTGAALCRPTNSAVRWTRHPELITAHYSAGRITRAALPSNNVYSRV